MNVFFVCFRLRLQTISALLNSIYGELWKVTINGKLIFAFYLVIRIEHSSTAMDINNFFFTIPLWWKLPKEIVCNPTGIGCWVIKLISIPKKKDYRLSNWKKMALMNSKRFPFCIFSLNFRRFSFLFSLRFVALRESPSFLFSFPNTESNCVGVFRYYFFFRFGIDSELHSHTQTHSKLFTLNCPFNNTQSHHFHVKEYLCCFFFNFNFFLYNFTLIHDTIGYYEIWRQIRRRKIGKKD